MQFNLLDCVKSHLENSDLHFDDIAPIVIPENHPWLNKGNNKITELRTIL